MELIKDGLDNRIFTAFSETSKTKYPFICNLETNVSRWSRYAVEYFGLPGEYMYDAGLIWEQFIHPDDRTMYHQELADVFEGRKQLHRVEYRARNRNGNYVICSCQGMILPGTNGEPPLFAGTILNHGILSNVDAATDLYNTYEFLHALQQLIQDHDKSMVMLICLNQFHNINSIYGYITGTKVLRCFAGLLNQAVRGKGMAYRMDGAKFALRLRDPDPDKAKRLFHHIQRTAELGFRVDGQLISVRTCAGCVEMDGSHTDVHVIQSCLVHAMQQSKQEPMGSLVLFNNAESCTDLQTIPMMETLRRCVLQNSRGYYLVYQPVVEPQAGKVVGAEALLRWHGTPYGELSPGAFIEWLERDRCYFELGIWILRQAMQDMLPLVRQNPDFHLGVNVAYTQLAHFRFREVLLDLLRETGFPPQCLCLELTERCRTGDLTLLRDTLQFVVQQEVRLALDDFGTGTASIQLLRELPVSCIKIDRTFVSDILTNPTDEILVEFISNSAKKLGLNVCIEGIESPEQKAYVDQFSPTSYQGYLFSKPVPIQDFNDYYQIHH